MKVEFDNRDVNFSTFAGPYGKMRACVVNLGGKPFFFTRTIESWREDGDPDFAKQMDEMLVRNMERVIQGLLEKLAICVPEGQDLGELVFSAKLIEDRTILPNA